MEPTTGILTQILKLFIDTLDLGMGRLRPTALSLFVSIGTLELLLAGIFWALSGSEAAVNFLKKMLLFSFVYWGVTSYQEILKWITDGFKHAGTVAAGGFQVDAIENPSLIVDLGWASVYPLMQMAQRMSDDWEFFDALFATLSSIVIIISYYMLALQVLLVRIEFALVATIGFILLPFGAFSRTAFLAEKVMGAIIQFGVRLMALSLIIGLTYPLLAKIKLPADPGWDPIIFMVGTSIVMAAISWHAPGVVAGLFTGMPSLTTATLSSAPGAVGSAAGVGVRAGAAMVTGVAAAPLVIATAAQAGKTVLDTARQTFSRADNGAGNSGSPQPTSPPVQVTEDMRNRVRANGQNG